MSSPERESTRASEGTVSDGALPPLPGEFLRYLDVLEKAYLAETDPIRGSGFAGGAERWRQEREPLLDAVESDGDLLDAGCANGYLVECLVGWARERGFRITPYGVDNGIRLIQRAQRRLPQWASHFYVGNAWDWEPPRRFRYVYTLHDCVPLSHLDRYIRRLANKFVAPSGRLILGAYGSRSRNFGPHDVRGALEKAGFRVAGSSHGGTPPIAAFAWIDV